jgi:hypothetical protein
MHYPLASLFLVLSGFGNLALGQASQTGQIVTPNPPAQSIQTAQTATTPAAPATTPAAAIPSDKPRIYVTDSNSWSTQAVAGGSHGSFGASSSGGARPQTR